MAQDAASRPAALRGQRVDRLRIRHLRLLELIAVHGSLTGAATALRLSQPSVTKMLQELEHAFGCTLVQRNVRGGQLSTAGLRALDRLRVAIGALDAAGEALGAQPERPLVRVGALPLAGVWLIPEAAALLHQRGLLPRLELHEGAVDAMVDMLCAGRVDCVVGRVDKVQAYGDGRLNIVPLADEGFEVACARGHPLARRRRLTLAQLRDAPWITPSRGSYTRKVFDAAFVSMGLIPPVPDIESPSFHTSLATAARTHHLVIAPRSAVRLYLGIQRVARLSLAQPFQTDFAAFLTLPAMAGFAPVALLRDALQEVVRNPPDLRVPG